MKAYLLCLLGLALLLPGCKDVESVVNDNYSVTGTVTEAETQQPLAGVEVTLVEDREPIINGGTVIRTVTTDQNGNYSFNFKWKDSPYEVYVSKPGYYYTRDVVNVITYDTLKVTYQNVEFGKHQSQVNFEMKLVDHLVVNLKNVAPADGLDQLVLTVRETRNGPAVVGPFYEYGLIEKDLNLGLFTPGTYVYLDYSVTHQNQTTQHLDSVLIQPHTLQTYQLHY